METKSDPKDVELEALITRHIREMGSHIHVQARAGVVSLSGSANEFETKRAITTMVHEIAGVIKVVNNIRVSRGSDGEFENYT